MEDRKFVEGFFWGFAITTLIWCILFAYTLVQLK